MLERLFSTYQIADLLGASHGAVINWIEKGWLPVKHLPGKQVRISEKGLVRFLKERGIDMNAIMAKVAASEGQGSGGMESMNASPSKGPDIPLPDELRVDTAIDATFPEAAAVSEEDSVLKPLLVKVESSAPEEFPSPQEPPSSGPAVDDEAAPAVAKPVDPAVQVADALLEDAAARRVSHIHLDSVPDGLSLRVRIDGVLYERANFKSRLPKELAPRLIAHFKGLAGLEAAETDRPQEGRFGFTVDGREMDLRLTTCPTVYGQRLVIHLLERDEGISALPQLGFAKEDLSRLEVMLDGRCGLILVTGLPGSGRATTLRAMLAGIDAAGRSLIAVESSGETRIEGVSRISVDDGFTSAEALGGLGGQDADVIMVDDITDGSAMSAAVAAALAGRLVLAGLFARSTAVVLEMMLESAKRWPLASALLGVISQRTVRRICPECRREVTPTADLLDRLNIRADDVNFPICRGDGCDACSRTGYSGRTGLFSLLPADGAVAAAMRSGAGADEIEIAAERAGMKSLRRAGLDKVRAGITSLEEIARVLPATIP